MKNEQKIVSFDIFDTLLIRKLYAPKDIFSYIEHKTGKKGFAKWRKTAEFLLRAKLHKHVTIHEIYQFAPSLYKDLEKDELDAEDRFITANSDIQALFNEYKNRGYRIVCISDMYLPTSFIRQLLQKNGYSGIDKIYISCEHNTTKLFGGLFRVLCKDLDIESSELTHIGDNRLTDYFVPSLFGINCHHYQTDKRLFNKKTYYIRHFYKKHPNLAHSIIADIIASHGKNNIGLKAFGFNVVGPMVLSYSAFIANECKNRGIDTILLLSRDGYYIQKCLNLFFKQFNTEYIYAPRMQYYITHYDTDFRDPTIPKGILSYYNIKAVFKSLYIKRHKDEMIKLYEKEREKLNYASYIKAKTANRKSFCIVEGTSGRRTSQKFVQNELNKTIPTFYIQRLPYIREKQVPSIPFLHFPKHFIINRVNKSRFIEKIFTSPDRSVEFINGEGEITFADETKNDIYREKKYHHIEAGMEEFFNSVLMYSDMVDIFKDNTVFEDMLLSFAHFDRKNYKKVYKMLKMDKWYLYYKEE